MHLIPEQFTVEARQPVLVLNQSTSWGGGGTQTFFVRPEQKLLRTLEAESWPSGRRHPLLPSSAEGVADGVIGGRPLPARCLVATRYGW